MISSPGYPTTPPYPVPPGTKSQEVYRTKLPGEELRNIPDIGYKLVGKGDPKSESCGHYIGSRKYEDGSLRHRHITCQRSSCPVCFMDWAKKVSKRETGRLFDLERSLRPGAPCRFKHLSFSISPKDPDFFAPEKLRKKLKGILPKWGITRGIYVFHPFSRISRNKPYQTGNLKYHPHFHILTPQFLKRLSKKEKGLWNGYNHGQRMRGEEGVTSTILYELSHAGTTGQLRHKILRSFGDYAMSKKELIEDSEIEYKDYFLAQGMETMVHKSIQEVESLDLSDLDILDDDIFWGKEDDKFRLFYVGSGVENRKKWKYHAFIGRKRSSYFPGNRAVVR